MSRSQAGWRAVMPPALRRHLRPAGRRLIEWRRRRPLRLGDLRRTTPVDPSWGFQRGVPIDRTYIEAFIGANHPLVRGRVLEIAAPTYASRFGHHIESVDVLMVDEGNPEATIVADLTDAPHIPDESFDCAIVTQTLQFVYDVRLALQTLHRVLAPGGVLLATVPGLTKISPSEDAAWGEWWHFTGRSARRLAEEQFGADAVSVTTYGNVLTASGFLYGLAASDLREEEIVAHDPLYEVIIGIVATKRPDANRGEG